MTPAVISKHTTLAEEKGYLYKKRRFNGSILYTITIPIADNMIVDVDANGSSGLETSARLGDLDADGNPMTA